MKQSEAKQHAKNIVFGMLGGRCCPEPDDVADITERHAEQQMIIEEINVILDRMTKMVSPKPQSKNRSLVSRSAADDFASILTDSP